MKPKLNFEDISKFRFWSGVVVFFIYSFLFLNFIALLLESVAYGKNIDALTLIYPLAYNEYKFYIFFLAFYVNCFVSLIVLEIWYNKPAHSLRAKKTRRFVLYERKGFLNLFSLWLFRFVFILFIFHNSSFLGCFPLYTEHKYLFLLLAIVLFSDLWIGFRRVYKVNWFYPLGFLIFIIAYSFSLTHIRPYNDKAKIDLINKGYHYKGINLPVLDKCFPSRKSYRISDIYLTGNNNVYIHDNEFSLSQIKEEIYNSNSEIRQLFNNSGIVNSIGGNTINSFIDKNLKMKDVNSFFKVILASGLERVNIKVYTPRYECDNSSLSIPLYLPAFQESFYHTYIKSIHPKPPPPPPINVFPEITEKNIIKVKLDSNTIKLNDTIISLEKLENILVERNNKRKIITLKYSEEIDFQTYLETYNAIRNSIYEQRDELSYKLTGFSYLTLKNEQESSYGVKKEESKEHYKLIRETHPFKFYQKMIVKNE